MRIDLLQDVQKHLRTEIPDSAANVVLMHDNVTNWNPKHAKADILIHCSETAPVSPVRDSVKIELYVFARQYAGSNGVVEYLDQIRSRLGNYRSPEAAEALKWNGDRFVKEDSGIWVYVQFYSTTVANHV